MKYMEYITLYVYIYILKEENIIPTLLIKNLPDTYSSNELYNLCNGFGPIESYHYESLCNIGSVTYNIKNRSGKIPRNALLTLTGSYVKNKHIKVEFDKDGMVLILYIKINYFTLC